jgi:hypothetical protein
MQWRECLQVNQQQLQIIVFSGDCGGTSWSDFREFALHEMKVLHAYANLFWLKIINNMVTIGTNQWRIYGVEWVDLRRPGALENKK